MSEGLKLTAIEGTPFKTYGSPAQGMRHKLSWLSRSWILALMKLDKMRGLLLHSTVNVEVRLENSEIAEFKSRTF
jgi:hypothetical protein